MSLTATSDSERFTVPGLHRILSSVSVVGLLATFRAVWIHTVTFNSGLGLAVSLCYFGVFALAVIALCSRGTRRLAQCDGGILGLAIVVEALQLVRYSSSSFRYKVDEGILGQRALDTFRHGHNPYTESWPHAVAAAPTQLMDGHVVARFEYPPLSLLLGYVAGAIFHVLATPTFVCGVALIASAVVAYVLLPAQFRPLVVLLLFAVPFETARTLGGSPAIVALPFLLVAVLRWPETGAGGRLGRSGVARALCFGLAISAQQLSWFIAPFLLVGLWRVRRAELSRRATAKVLGRYFLLALAVFAIINVPFVVLDAHRWWTGVTGVLTQHAVLYGPGLAMVSGNITSGSGALSYFSYATGFVYVALLVVFAVGIRRLGPVMSLLPMIVFLLAIRSEDTYYVVFAPLWLLTAASLRRDDFAAAPPVSLPSWLTRRRGLVPVAASALFLPAVGCLVFALASRPPLQLHVLATTQSTSHRVSSVGVSADNRSDHAVSPHFAFVVNAQLGRYWDVQSGPSVVGPGQTGYYTLTAPSRAAEVPADSGVRLAAFADDPQTLSSTHLPPDG